MREVTRAFHCGGYEKVCLPHNRREPEYCAKEKHIDPAGYHKTLEERDLAEVYDELFTPAIREYNKGKKPSRQVYGQDGREYLEYLTKSFKEQEEKNAEIREHNAKLQNGEKKLKETHKIPSPVREIIVGWYPTEGKLTNEEGEKMCREFLEDFKKKNPQLVVVGAYLHGDEPGGVHMHIDYIPLAYQNRTGLAVQPVESRSLQEMGYEKVEECYDASTKSFDLPKTRFEEAMREVMDQIAERHGLEVLVKGEKRAHLEKEDFIAHQELEATKAELSQVKGEKETLEEYAQELQEEVSHLTAQVKEKTTILERLEGLFVALQYKVEEFFTTKEKHASLEATERQKGKPEQILHRVFGSARKAQKEAESAYSKLKGLPFKGEAVESVESTFQSFEQKADLYREAVESVEEELEGWER